MPSSFLISRYSFRTVIAAILMVSVVFSSPVARGQSDLARTSEDPSSRPEFQYKVIWSSDIGSYTYAPEKWGDLRINLVNSRDEPRDLLCMTYFNDRPNLQFGRRVWVPPKSVMRLSHPVVIPPCDPNKGRALNIQSLVVDTTGGNDVLVKNRSGQLLHDGALLVTHSSRNTGLIGQVADSDRSIPPLEVTDLIEAARVSQHMSGSFSLLLDNFLPADESGLSCFDQIVIAENRIMDDLAALSALRHWLHRGGHLWVMLDQADPLVLEKLLGDDFRGHVLDRVGLTSVRVDKTPSLTDPDGSLGETFEYEEPVDLVRMVASNFEVTHVVNGWPAAMSKPFGDGTVLITTLGPRGWMRESLPGDQISKDPQFRSRFVPTDVMKNLAAEFFGVREPEIVSREAIEPQVRQYIGYSIPSQGLIVGTLIGFSLVLIAIAIALLKSGRLESLGWIGSLLAVAVSIVLVSVGRSYRHGIPPTLATIQLAQAMEGTDDVREQGVVAVYQPNGSASQIQVKGGGEILPDLTGLENSPRRMVTTDLGVWHWEELPQPSGLRTTSFARAESVSDRIEALATFDANGIVGKFSGRLAPGSDALIATRHGRIGVALSGNGMFVGRADEVLERDQYLSSGYVNDEQERRQRTLEKLLTNPKRKDFPNRPQLMFWVNEWEHGFHFGDGMKSQGATLVAVPLVFERPPVGTDYVIPSPLLPYRNQRDPEGNPSATMWNYGRNEWQERSTPGTAWLNFHLPNELLPVKVNRARIDLKVSGPVGRIEILGLKNGAVVRLQTIVDPVGSLSIDLNDADSLSMAADGGLVLGLSAGDPSRPELTQTPDASSKKGSGKSAVPRGQDMKVNYWKIESLMLQLWVKSTEPNLKD